MTGAHPGVLSRTGPLQGRGVARTRFWPAPIVPGITSDPIRLEATVRCRNPSISGPLDGGAYRPPKERSRLDNTESGAASQAHDSHADSIPGRLFHHPG